MKMKVMIYEDLGHISGIFEVLLDFYQIAAGPPASKPRKKPALCGVIFQLRPLPGWLRVPNAADKVHCDETRGKIFDEIPSTVELLKKTIMGSFNASSLEKPTGLYPSFVYRRCKKERVSNSALVPPHERERTIRKWWRTLGASLRRYER